MLVVYIYSPLHQIDDAAVTLDFSTFKKFLFITFYIKITSKKYDTRVVRLMAYRDSNKEGHQY